MTTFNSKVFHDNKHTETNHILKTKSNFTLLIYIPLLGSLFYTSNKENKHTLHVGAL